MNNFVLYLLILLTGINLVLPLGITINRPSTINRTSSLISRFTGIGYGWAMYTYYQSPFRKYSIINGNGLPGNLPPLLEGLIIRNMSSECKQIEKLEIFTKPLSVQCKWIELP